MAGLYSRLCYNSPMLQNTFCHVRGVGPKTERRLWAEGILCWDDAPSPDVLPLGRRTSEEVVRVTDRSAERLSAGDATYFSRNLASREHWRLFPEFRHSVAYLDIETTGLGNPGDYITVVGLYDGEGLRQYVYGENMEQFRDDIGGYRVIITYNGKTFDVPFIRNYLAVSMEHAHIDLRYVLAGLGLRGGLKSCEKQLGVDRGELDGIDGYTAVLLWHDYHRNGNERARETLLAYNAADVLNLERLMVLAYNLKLGRTVFKDTHRLHLPSVPPLPCRPDRKTVARLTGAAGERF